MEGAQEQEGVPKSASDFAKVNMEKIDTSIQVTAAKLRMSLKEQKENNGQETDDVDVKLSRVYDPDERTVNMSKFKKLGL